MDTRNYSAYAQGNTVLRPEPEEIPFKPSTPEELEQIRQRLETRIKERALAKKKAAVRKAIIAACYSIGVFAVFALCVMALSAVIASNTLTGEIEDLQSEVSELSAENDSLEYDIDSAVSLADVADYATNTLGMVMNSSDQIVYYSTTESEYIQQVAGLPEN